jgi:hypothetical protein
MIDELRELSRKEISIYRSNDSATPLGYALMGVFRAVAKRFQQRMQQHSTTL